MLSGLEGKKGVVGVFVGRRTASQETGKADDDGISTSVLYFVQLNFSATSKVWFGRWNVQMEFKPRISEASGSLGY
jgi:hypothetical protein